MNDETIKYVTNSIIFGLLIIFCMLLMTAIFLSRNPAIAIIRMETDNNTLGMVKIASDLSNYASCIDKCKYIELKYNTTKEEAYNCFWNCER